jgi:hypothetical protein
MGKILGFRLHVIHLAFGFENMVQMFLVLVMIARKKFKNEK